LPKFRLFPQFEQTAWFTLKNEVWDILKTKV